MIERMDTIDRRRCYAYPASLLPAVLGKFQTEDMTDPNSATLAQEAMVLRPESTGPRSPPESCRSGKTFFLRVLSIFPRWRGGI